MFNKNFLLKNNNYLLSTFPNEISSIKNDNEFLARLNDFIISEKLSKHESNFHLNDEFDKFHQSAVEFILFGIDNGLYDDLGSYFKNFKIFKNVTVLPQKKGNIRNISQFDFNKNSLKINLNSKHHQLDATFYCKSKIIDRFLCLYDSNMNEKFFANVTNNIFELKNSVFNDIVFQKKTNSSNILEIKFNFNNNSIKLDNDAFILPISKKICCILIVSEKENSFEVLNLKIL